jgi:hypothetical protein
LKNCKKYLAIYNSKLDSNGNIPSDKIEDDIIFEVLHDLYQAKAGDKEDESDTKEVEEEAEDGDNESNIAAAGEAIVGNATGNSNTSPDADDDMISPPNCTTTDDIGKIIKVPSSFLPPTIFGPASEFGVHSLLSVDFPKNSGDNSKGREKKREVAEEVKAAEYIVSPKCGLLETMTHKLAQANAKIEQDKKKMMLAQHVLKSSQMIQI